VVLANQLFIAVTADFTESVVGVDDTSTAISDGNHGEATDCLEVSSRHDFSFHTVSDILHRTNRTKRIARSS